MEQSAKARFDALKSAREPFLRRGREGSSLTIPSLLPPMGQSPSADLPQPYSGLGARAVVNLASRLMAALLPPGMPFFRLNVPPEVLAEAGTEVTPPDLERKVALAEKLIHAEVERRSWRQPTFVVLQHLIVTGNALEHQLPDNRIRVFRLDQYVVVRDPLGSLAELVIEENLTPASLPEKLRPLVADKDTVNDRVAIYTWLRRVGDTWTVVQQIADHDVPGSKGKFKDSQLPFRALRWSPVLGEDYGRAKVEEHISDFRALNGLTKATLDGAAMASRNITMIRPNAAGGLNLRKRLAQANNGETVIGNPEDVQMLQFANTNGMQFTTAELAVVKQELAGAFLLGSAMRRDAERVTAYELRQVVEELEGTLGGVYSTLAQEMMSPRIARLIPQMQANDQLPAWPPGTLEPVVLTGLEALGREADVNRVSTAIQLVGALPPEVQQYVKWPAVFAKAFLGLGLPDCTRSEEEVQAIMQQQQMAQMAQQVAPIAAQAQADRAAQASPQ